MKAVVQRVSRASVIVDGKLISSIDKGLLVLLGIEEGDDSEPVLRLADRLPRYRFFEDDDDEMNLSTLDVGGSILVVSQFTLAANLQKGLRPSFTRAMAPDKARELVSLFCRKAGSTGVEVKQGVFGAHMDVELVNDGPVTFIFDGAGK